MLMKIYYCVGLKELAKASVTTKEFLTAVEGVLREIGQNDFQAFIQRLSKTDDTWKFRAGFKLEALFLAIRCQNWNLRMSSLKKMAPLF